MAPSSLGEPVLLTLCSVAEAGTGLKYICFNTSLKITSGKKGTRHKGSMIREGEKTFSEILPFQPEELARLYRARVLWLVINDIIPRASPPSSQPHDVISAEASQWCNAGRYSSSTPSFFPCLPLSSPPASSFPFLSPSPSFHYALSAHQLHPDKKSFPTCLLALKYKAQRFTVKPRAIKSA